MENTLKTVILAGGLGTRLAELTGVIPKPMVPVGGRPIIWHIMQIYAYYGFTDFVLALGYKSELIKEYFLNYSSMDSDFTVNLADGGVSFHNRGKINWNVTLVDTGENSMTGGRLKRLKNFLNNETFMLTYGDGVADVSIRDLVSFHKSHKKMVSVTTVHPMARFGEVTVVNDKITSFKEKPQMTQGWVNGGFFVMEPEIFDFLEDDNTVLEQSPLESIANAGELMAFFHKGFWQCMDTTRDHQYLESLWKEKAAPWKIW